MLILGLGTDIIEIWRIKKAIDRHKTRFLQRVFTHGELRYCRDFSNPYPHFAARFAAKEAIFKTLREQEQAGISWQDIEIINDLKGRPEVVFSPRLKEKMANTANIHCLLSMSHCDDYATATALLMGN